MSLQISKIHPSNILPFGLLWCAAWKLQPAHPLGTISRDAFPGNTKHAVTLGSDGAFGQISTYMKSRAIQLGVSYSVREELFYGDGWLRCRKKSRVEAVSNTSTVALRVARGDENGNLEPERVKYGRESHGTQTRGWMRWRGPAANVNDRPILSSEDMMLYCIRTMAASVQLRKKSGRESQGARRQDELIGSKPSVVK
jgi:hypothetical protein